MQNEVTGYPDSVATAKAQANRLMTAMGGKRQLSHSQALEMIAGIHGKKSWAEMSAGFSSASAPALTTIPDQPGHAMSRFRLPLFTANDFIMFAERTFTQERVIWEVIERSVLCVSPLGIISTGACGLFESNYAEISGPITSYDPHPFLTPEKIRSIFKDMISTADARYDRDINAPSRLGMAALDSIISDVRKNCPEARVLHEKPMDIDMLHSIAITASPRKMIVGLRDKKVRVSFDLGTRRVIDLFSREDLDDLKKEPELGLFYLQGLIGGEHCVNPVSIMGILIKNSVKNFTEQNEAIVVVSMEDARNTIGLKAMLEHAKKVNTHFVFVADGGEVPKDVAKGVRQVWVDGPKAS